MPANLTPEYLKADKWYRSAADDGERLLALEEMLRTIPRHKGTEHMRAELRKKLSKLKAATSGEKKGGAKHVDIFHVPKSGAGQVVLVGTPNCGKSSIVGALSNAKVHIADYPFTTVKPVPGMAHHEDVAIQLVDMPPITADYSAPGQVGTYRTCDIIAIVIDLTQDIEEQVLISTDYLESHQLLIGNETAETDTAGNLQGKKAFIIAAKTDIAEPGSTEELTQLCASDFDIVEISAESEQDLIQLMAGIYRMLDIVRVYAKKPGKPADMKDPFTMPTGATVQDLANLVHRELAQKLRSARAWGENIHDGQNVHRTYQPSDKDIIELHF